MITKTKNLPAIADRLHRVAMIDPAVAARHLEVLSMKLPTESYLELRGRLECLWVQEAPCKLTEHLQSSDSGSYARLRELNDAAVVMLSRESVGARTTDAWGRAGVKDLNDGKLFVEDTALRSFQRACKEAAEFFNGYAVRRTGPPPREFERMLEVPWAAARTCFLLMPGFIAAAVGADASIDDRGRERLASFQVRKVQVSAIVCALHAARMSSVPAIRAGFAGLADRGSPLRAALDEVHMLMRRLHRLGLVTKSPEFQTKATEMLLAAGDALARVDKAAASVR